jgi:hypothetical protein
MYVPSKRLHGASVCLVTMKKCRFSGPNSDKTDKISCLDLAYLKLSDEIWLALACIEVNQHILPSLSRRSI